MLITNADDIGADFAYTVDGQLFRDLAADVVFVAIKNGRHNGIGYFLDSGSAAGESAGEFPLATMPQRVVEALLGPSEADSLLTASR